MDVNEALAQAKYEIDPGGAGGFLPPFLQRIARCAGST
jgi:hypothetical protein